MRKSRKKILAGLGIFLGAMLLLTLLSRGIYASQLSCVTVSNAKRMVINHKVEAIGNVCPGKQLALNVASGLRVKEVSVLAGDRVEEGDPLFVLDTEALADLIADKKLELAKQKLTLAAMEKNRALENTKKSRDKDRTQEDTQNALEDAQKQLERALEDEAKAQKQLSDHEAARVNLTPQEERQKQQEAYEKQQQELKDANAQAASTASGQAQLQNRINLLEHRIEQGKQELATLEEQILRLEEEIKTLGGLPGSKDAAVHYAKETEGKDETDQMSEETNPTAPVDDVVSPDIVPGDTISPDIVPDDSVTSDTVPDDTTSIDTVPGDNAFLDTVPPTTEAAAGSSDLDQKKAQLEEKKAQREQKKVEIDSLERELSSAKEALLLANAQAQSAQDRVGQLQSSALEAPNFEGEDARQQAWESTRDSLDSQAKAAHRNTEDALDKGEDTLREGKRSLEDATLPETADATIEVARLDLERLQQEVAELEEYLQAEGIIRAKQTATIMGVMVSPGENTGTGASLVFADSSRPLQFLALLDREQKQYVDLGLDANLSLGSSQDKKIPVTVDYLTESPLGDGSWQLLVNLPENTGTIGQSGSFSLTVPSRNYDCCIPLDALHKDANGREFVYVISSADTILGKELTVRRIMVEVLDQNESYAALAPGSLDSEMPVVVSMTKEVQDGDVVRILE